MGAVTSRFGRRGSQCGNSGESFLGTEKAMEKEMVWIAVFVAQGNTILLDEKRRVLAGPRTGIARNLVYELTKADKIAAEFEDVSGIVSHRRKSMAPLHISINVLSDIDES